MNHKSILPLIFLAIIFVADLYLLDIQHVLRPVTKSLLIPILFIYYYVRLKQIGSRYIYGGLFFSWLGDILLTINTPTFFMLGLTSFLITHICYIIYFIRLKGHKSSFLKQRPIMLLVIIAYLVELLHILWPGLGGMKGPVIIYAIVISTMFSAAAWQYEKIENRPALFFIIGSFLFVLSDSILAISKFVHPFSYGGILVMTTYILAQFLIVNGSISFHNSLSNNHTEIE